MIRGLIALIALASMAHAQDCRIRVDRGNGISDVGSGVAIEHNGQTVIVTAKHVVVEPNPDSKKDTPDRIWVDFYDYTPKATYTFSAVVAKRHPTADVAILTPQTTRRISTRRLGDMPRVGDRVGSIGHSNGAKTPTNVESTVVAVNRYQGPANIVVSYSPVQGRSGGALYAGKNVIGICSGALKTGGGLFDGVEAIRELLDGPGSPRSPSSQRLTLRVFKTQFCSPCNQFQAEYNRLSSGLAKAIGDRYDHGKQDVIYLDGRKDIADRYKIYVTPTFVLYDSDGREVYRVERFLDGKTLLSDLAKARQPRMVVEKNQRCRQYDCVPVQIPVPRPQIDYGKVAEVVYQRYGAQLRGRDGVNGTNGVDGRDGNDGQSPQIDLDQLAQLLTTNPEYASRIRGQRGNDGGQGPQGPKGDQGNDGLVGVPSQKDIRNWLIGASSDPETKLMLSAVFADLVAADPRTRELIERLEALERREYQPVPFDALEARLKALESRKTLKGERGLGIQKISLTDDNHLLITYTDGTVDRIGPISVSSPASKSTPAFFDIVPKGK